MSRIDVVKADKGFKVMVNFGSMGCFNYSSHIQANKEAQMLQSKYPQSKLNLMTE